MDDRRLEISHHPVGARVGALGFPGIGQTAEVLVALQEVVGDTQQGGAEPTVGAADQGAVAQVHRVALVTRGEQARSSGDGAGMSIVGDRSHLPGELRGGGYVNAGNGRRGGPS
jgi:hypothetical protein